ncbi:MAG TPA: DUF5996 family protein [Gammaproteobacteria bacterium]
MSVDTPSAARLAAETWPPLPYEAWKDTYATLHMWTQVVGKVALRHAPPLNHGWGSAFHLTPHGLRTALLAHGERDFAIEFDFLAHRLVIDTSDGARRTIPLAPRPVADFYREVLRTLDEMGLPVRIWSTPVEIPSPIPFERDDVHRSYDAEQVRRWWEVLRRAHRVLTACRCAFVGKSSPVHFFWGSFDLAVTRFSGRPAPPREGPAFMRDAYSHEVISHGFWPGNDALPEPAFYAYAVPGPPGLEAAPVQPAGAYYHPELKEFLLPYETARTASAPDVAIAEFVDSTYRQAATLAGWDLEALDRLGPAAP